MSNFKIQGRPKPSTAPLPMPMSLMSSFGTSANNAGAGWAGIDSSILTEASNMLQVKNEAG